MNILRITNKLIPFRSLLGLLIALVIVIQVAVVSYEHFSGFDRLTSVPHLIKEPQPVILLPYQQAIPGKHELYLRNVRLVKKPDKAHSQTSS